MTALPPRLRALVDSLDALGPVVTRRDALASLAGADLRFEDVAPYAQPSTTSYARRRIARTDAFELLVMTWLPGQGSAPHDHAGSVCALRIVRGRVRETLHESARDGLVDAASAGELLEGEVLVDDSEHIHALVNDTGASETLVTLHVYAPPLPELRRFALRPAGSTPPPAFARVALPGAPVVAVVGGGVCGTLVAAHLVRLATSAKRPVHVVVFDRQAAHGEGPAYRTADARHLLNVPASNMSALPDAPTHFLEWARARDAHVAPGTFVSRRLYGDYVRSVLVDAVKDAGESVSAEIRREDVRAVERRDGGFSVSAGETSLDATCVVLATGHRPPDDPLATRWTGPRSRYVEDPWASLALSAIAPDESVVLLGTGLTAVDVLLTVCRAPRSATITAISRRGLLPETHATQPGAPIDPRPWLDPLLASPALTARALLRGVRDAVRAAATEHVDWRRVVDGMRPHLSRLWQALPQVEAARFLRHVRPYWEVRRHRMAPVVGDAVTSLASSGVLHTVAGRVVRASADTHGVELEVRRRGAARVETVRADWVVNCSGPGAGGDALPPVLRALVEAGELETDVHGLGVRTDSVGRAQTTAGIRDDLFVLGTLRKADLWESTAVPELRVQAQAVAGGIASKLGW